MDSHSPPATDPIAVGNVAAGSAAASSVDSPVATTTSRAPDRRERLALVVLLLLALGIILATYRDYGVTWDEHVQSTYGELCLTYFRTQGDDDRALTYLNLRFYPPIFEMACAWAYQHVPAAKWEIRHLLTALFGLVGVGALAMIFRQGQARWGGLAAAAALLAMPRWYGHMFGNSKDIPFAVGFAIGMWVLIHCFDGKPLTWRRTVLLAFACGLALSMRVGAFLLAPFAIGALTLLLLQRLALRRPSPPLPALTRLAVQLASVVAGSWVLMIIAWPWVLVNPLAGPIQAFRIVSRFPYIGEVLFRGSYIEAADLPRSYLPIWLGISIPLPILVLFGVGAGIAVVQLVRHWRTPRAIGLALMLVWVFFPIAYAVVTKPVLYDGMRHFLFILPPIAWFAGHAVASIVSAVPTGKARLATALAGGAALLFAVPAEIRLHPFQYTYFNESVGGVGKAQFRFETDYWCTSYKQAFEWLNERAKTAPGGRLNVLVAGTGILIHSAEAYAGPDLKLIRFWGDPKQATADFDYYVATPRFRMAAAFPEVRPIYNVTREGAIFTVIKPGPGLAIHAAAATPDIPAAVETVSPTTDVHIPASAP